MVRPNSSTMVSKVHLSPRRLQNTPFASISKGAAPNRLATAGTSDGVTDRKTAYGPMKRRMSQKQAIRSSLGLARVTCTVRP